MNIFKILIPKGNAQEVRELESWKVSWKVAKSIIWGHGSVNFKCFLDKAEAKEFRKQLEESAKFIDTPIVTDLERN